MSEISANDLVDLVREVENDIKKAIQPILNEFQATTGFSISGVWSSWESATTNASAHPEYILTKVHCEVTLRE